MAGAKCLSKLEPPLNRLRLRRMKSVLLERLGEPRATADAKALIWLPDSQLPAFEVLASGLSDEEWARLERKELDPLDEVGGVEGLLALLDGCPVSRVKRRTVVFCWADSSMVCGEWGLSTYKTPQRGYVVVTQDEVPLEDNYLILGAWEPAADADARRACVIRCYARNWIDCTLPPQLGECASGEQPLWLECLLHLAESQRGVWEEICSQLRMLWKVDRDQLRFVSRLSGLRTKRLKELYAEAGVRTSPARPAATADSDFDEDEGDGETRWHLLAQAAPIDPQSARFLLANYCCLLERVGLSG